MSRAVSTCLAVLALAMPAAAAPPAAAAGTDAWVGQKVFFKTGAKGRIGQQEIPLALLLVPAIVETVDGDWLWIGNAWIRRADALTADQAIDYFTRQIEKAPTDAAAWQSRGMVRDAQRDHDRAIQDYTETIRLDPKNATAYADRGEAWLDKGDLDQAIRDWTSALKLAPKFSAVYNDSAWLRATSPEERYRDGAKAVANATKACELTDWKNPLTLDTLSAGLRRTGKFRASHSLGNQGHRVGRQDRAAGAAPGALCSISKANPTATRKSSNPGRRRSTAEVQIIFRARLLGRGLRVGGKFSSGAQHHQAHNRSYQQHAQGVF